VPPQIETNRLILRPFTLEDADAAYAALESHPDTWKFNPSFQRTREQRTAIIHKYAENNDPDSAAGTDCNDYSTRKCPVDQVARALGHAACTGSGGLGRYADGDPRK
jgi:RimJ/RimL family protein N-acetyltransferase